MTGRLLFWDHLGDQIAHTLCPSGKDFDEPTVYRGSLPLKLPPGVNIDEVAGPTPLPKTWDNKMKEEDTKDREPRDLEIPLIDLQKDQEDQGREEDEDYDDVLLETHSSQHNLPQDCPLASLHLSSENSKRDESLESLSDIPASSDDLQKQGISRILELQSSVWIVMDRQNLSGWRQGEGN